jgi:hypothetical protein
MPYFLPNKYQFKHNFLYFLYGVLVRIVKTGENTGVFQHAFELKNSNDIDSIQKLSSEDIIDFLQDNGYEEEVNEMLKRQIFDAVLSDFLQFIQNALITSERAQLSVTFSLLRKPLKDNLLILEWILADSSDFLKEFKSNDSNKSVAIDKLTKEKKIQIISGAIDKTERPFFPADFMYELRYDKTKHYGFEQIWNKANHIITSNRNYATEDMNLNFVFSQESGKISQWNILYETLPSLLLYSIFVCDTIYKSFSNNKSIIDTELSIRLMSAYVLSENQLKEPGKEQLELTPLICRKCKSVIEMDKNKLKRIYEKGIYRCPKRHKNILFKI